MPIRLKASVLHQLEFLVFDPTGLRILSAQGKRCIDIEAKPPAVPQRTRDSTEMFLESIDRGNPVAFATAAFDGGAALVIGQGPQSTGGVAFMAHIGGFVAGVVLVKLVAMGVRRPAEAN